MGEAQAVGEQVEGQAPAPPSGQKGPTAGRVGFVSRAAAAMRTAQSSLAVTGLWPWAEATIIMLWALFITRAYLDLNPLVVPTGLEYLSVIQSHHLWTWVQECGACALWNGGQQGGAPALVELHGSPLHPLVALTTVLFGVLNGSKVALVAAFALAGLAQWWLGWVIGLGRLARLWSACMVVVAGHLAGRMEDGLFGVVFSTAACALVLPPVVLMGRRPTLHVTLLLGVVLALAALSGQGYVQIGLALLLAVVVPLQLLHSDDRRLLLRRYACAALLAGLLAGVFLVPFLHFLPSFTKNSDPTLSSNQPFGFMLLNLLINDSAFYRSKELQKLPYAWLYSFFIGWVPLLLALWGGFRGWAQERSRTIQWVAVGALVLLWLSSGSLLAWLAAQPALAGFIDQLTIIRYPPLFMTLAVPLLLALAGFGLDRLLRLRWPKLRLGLAGEGGERTWSVGTRWLLLVPLLVALNDARLYGAQWLTTIPQSPEVYDLLDALRTPDLQWVNLPFGEHFFIEPAVGMGLKLSHGIRQWGWRDRALPQVVMEASRNDVPPGMEPKGTVVGVPIFVAPTGREYAAVAHADGTRTVCSAHGRGGNIDVTCDTPRAGTLQIQENSWSGWGAQVNGASAALLPGQWLAMDVPAGQSTVQLRYRPWDVPLGILCSLCGIALAVWLWLRGRPAARIYTPVS
jgi:hypothetical protein